MISIVFLNRSQSGQSNPIVPNRLFLEGFSFRYFEEILVILCFSWSLSLTSERQKFTFEIENNNSIPFLNILIIGNNDNTIFTHWHRKIVYYLTRGKTQRLQTSCIRCVLFRVMYTIFHSNCFENFIFGTCKAGRKCGLQPYL